ncbi:MAG: MTH1187 family thiamine-binding protein [bacterium]
MAVAEITVTPLGTGSPSLSRYVAEVEKIIEESGIPYVLTPMSTCVQGSVDEILTLVKKVHACLFGQGVVRVVTTVKIDERLDKELTLMGKIQSVQEKMSHKGQK